MLKYGAMFYILAITSIATVQGCHSTTISPNASEANESTEVPCPSLPPNDYVDELISRLRNKTTDSIPLPDDPESTSLKDGKVWGLSTLERVGNATVVCNETLMTVEGLLSFEELKGRYTWEKTVLLKKFSGFVFVKADTAEVSFRVSQTHGNDTSITLEELRIKDLSGINTELTGMGVVTWAVNVITEPAAKLFKKSLARMVEGPLKQAIALALRDSNVPLY